MRPGRAEATRKRPPGHNVVSRRRMDTAMKAERNRPAQSPATRKASHDPLKDKSPQRMLPRRSNAWDPFEVWKTRVKGAPDTNGGE